MALNKGEILFQFTIKRLELKSQPVLRRPLLASCLRYLPSGALNNRPLWSTRLVLVL